MIRRNWKGKTSTVLAILMGTSLLMGGQAYAAQEKGHKSITHHKQHKQHKKHTQVKKSYQQDDQQAEQQTEQQTEQQIEHQPNQQTDLQVDKQSNDQQNNDKNVENNQNDNSNIEQSVDNTTQEENNVTSEPSKENVVPPSNQQKKNQKLEKTNDLAKVNPDSGMPATTDKLTNSFAAAPTAKSAAVSSNVANQVISNGLKYKGRPYKFGSSKNTTSTFDCSSFTQRVFKEAGITLPRDSRQQSRIGQQVSKNQLQKGDLIFFRSYGSSSSRITHVAIYAGNNTLLHTYGSPGVTTSKFMGTSWEKRFEIARRVTS